MTARHLYAIHDASPGWMGLVRSAGVTAWAVISESIGDDPNDHSGQDYTHLAAYGVTPIVRLNYSHHGQGTIPLPQRYDQFAARCANFVAASRGCAHWIIGNEPNHEIERYQGIPISPTAYASAYAKARQAIKTAGSVHQCIVAAVAPYNVNTGPWMDYWRTMLAEIVRLSGADGLALHFYGRGADPASVASDAKMDAPYSQYHNGFRAYRDLLGAVPEAMRHLPTFGTETNQGDNAWADANSGWVQAAYREIDEWNKRPGTQKIMCLALYRWERFDRWSLRDKPGVIADFEAAMKHPYLTPIAVPGGSGAEPSKPSVYIPVVQAGGSVAAPPPAPTLPRQWDERLTQRGVRIVEAQPAPGQTYWRVARGQWFNEQEADRIGPDRHILVDALDEAGRRVTGVSFVVTWPSGAARITTEEKPGEPYSANYPMSKSLNEFSITAVDGLPSDTVAGIGMGADGNSGVHTSTALVFQRAVAEAQPQPRPQPAKIPALVHPVQDPRYRTVTQPFGVNPDYYRQYAVDGVALRGHNGIDFGTPKGTQIVAVAAGRVVEVADEGDKGYGKYIKLSHEWGESLYAHLSVQSVQVGNWVAKGVRIGLSGDTGKVTGAHLHFGLRVAPFNRRDGWGGYTDPAPYLGVAPAQPSPGNHADIWAIVQDAAQEFGVDRYLLASLLWAESSWRPDAVSPVGAKGLGQIMDSTWKEWAPQVGASNPFDARDSARLSAAYLAWLLRTLGRDARQAVIAYNFGVGNVLAGSQPPDVTLRYVERVIFGRDLLAAVE